MENRILKVYVASPLGFSEATRVWYRETFLPALRACGVEILDPWDEATCRELEPPPASDTVLIAQHVSAWRDTNARIGRRNTRLLHQADGVVAVLDGADVDSGTAAEIGYATALGRWVLGYRGDRRPRGDTPGALVRLQVEYFVRMKGDIYTSLDDLVGALKEKVAVFNGAPVGPRRP